MFGMPKKNIKLITNKNRMLDLEEMGISTNDAIILNIRKSIDEIVNDKDEISLIKESCNSNKNVYVIIKENFPIEMGEIENLDDFKNKNKKIWKIFKKNDNLFFFFGNLSSEEKIYGIEDGEITMSDSHFFDEFDLQKKQLLEQERLNEIERQKLEDELLRKKIEEEENELNLNDEKINFEIDDEKSNELIEINDLSAEESIDQLSKIYSSMVDDTISSKEKILTNDFDKEFDEINKKENIEIEYPMLDSKEYLLKSIYDFIWRMLILSNNNLLLNDLLYLSINCFPSLSPGQNEFIRELSNEADSLFDIVLKLDYKLEFNNKLFYIYLANLFTIINGVCKVNREFLFDISIWVSDEARENFVTRIENFMNNNLVSIEKVIYSHFIEFATLTQSSIPRIKGSLKYEDIHLVLYKKIQNLRNRNLFCIILRNIFRTTHEIGLELESVILNLENIDNQDTELKKNVAKSYNILLEEVRNFIFLKGVNESNIPTLYNILMNIKINNIMDERIEVTNLSDLVNNEQIEIEDSYYKKIMENKDRNEIINIKYEEIESLYREAANAEKAKNINDEIFEFDLETIKEDLFHERKSMFNNEYGLDKDLSINGLKDFVEEDELVSNKIDYYENKIKANIKKMEEQRELIRERIERYSNKSSSNDDDSFIKLK